MTPIHILFAKMLVKMFHMSLKYIHLRHVLTSLGHPQVILFFKESIALHTLSLVLLSMPLYIYFWCYMVSSLPIAAALYTIGHVACLSRACYVGSVFSIPLCTPETGRRHTQWCGEMTKTTKTSRLFILC
jgi:hypothetical protein